MIQEPRVPIAARVLLVDDHALTRDLTSEILASAGYVVSLAENGAEAVAAVGHHHYDIVLMDLNMPVMDGFAACRAIRAIEPDPAKLPLVALSARREAGETERRRHAGIDGSLAKPFLPIELLTLVRRWTARTDQHSAPCREAGVWDHALYATLAEGLGARQADGLLTMFTLHLRRAVTALRSGLVAGRVDGPDLAREAHNIVSSAGMLGFAELERVSRTVMTDTDVATLRQRVEDFHRAADRVLACLESDREPFGCGTLGPT